MSSKEKRDVLGGGAVAGGAVASGAVADGGAVAGGGEACVGSRTKSGAGARETELASVLEQLQRGNVCSYTPRRRPSRDSSAGATAQRGSSLLKFDARFEGGNLGRVEYVSEYEYDLYIRPDTCNSSFRMWFNFCVSNVKRHQRVIFNIVNFSKLKSLYSNGMTPLVKSSSRPYWVRIPKRQVFYYRCPDRSRNYVLSITFAFDKEEDVYQFAYSYPYMYSDLQRFLDNMQKMNYNYFKRELIGFSTMKNRLELLTITSPHNLLKETTAKSVLITARIHPGETPSSFVCEGFMEFLLGKSMEARILRDNVIFKIVPMVNPDGVVMGNYRCTLSGLDLNRHWNDPSPLMDPSVGSIKDMIMKVDKSEESELNFYIDIHGHSTLPNGFMYGNMYEDEEKMLEEAIFPRILSDIAEDFSWSQTTFNSDTVKAGSSRRYLGWCLGSNTHCYTLEVSFFGYFPNDQDHPGIKMVPYTPESYRRLGRNVARTFFNFYGLGLSGSSESKMGRSSSSRLDSSSDSK